MLAAVLWMCRLESWRPTITTPAVSQVLHHTMVQLSMTKWTRGQNSLRGIIRVWMDLTGEGLLASRRHAARFHIKRHAVSFLSFCVSLLCLTAWCWLVFIVVAVCVWHFKYLACLPTMLAQVHPDHCDITRHEL